MHAPPADFDLGLATAQALVRQCNFPWLFSNVKDRDTGGAAHDARRARTCTPQRRHWAKGLRGQHWQTHLLCCC